MSAGGRSWTASHGFECPQGPLSLQDTATAGILGATFHFLTADRSQSLSMAFDSQRGGGQTIGSFDSSTCLCFCLPKGGGGGKTTHILRRHIFPR